MLGKIIPFVLGMLILGMLIQKLMFNLMGYIGFIPGGIIVFSMWMYFAKYIFSED